MIDYDFSTLNDKEFESISIELISQEKGKRFERFKPGKDAGVDGRFYTDEGKEEIIQCKHYIKTGYKGLIRTLENDEKEKVLILNPKKYYFITSLPLSRKNKQEIKKIFYPYIEKENDIYGQEDLNDILKKNPNIEERHYKLWLSSTTVLKRIFNNAIKGRSEFLLKDIQDKSKKYVITDNHQNALKKLNESHVIIIAGEPGIGKTTLAEHLTLKYIEQGFEFYVIENSLNEAEKVFNLDKKQLFYFDDFLGSNYLEALEFHQDSHIVKFIKRIKKDKNKRFILTSRTNIFNQSRHLSDTFSSNKIEKDEFIIKVDGLKEIEKAMILYNHIWHSELNEEYIGELYKEKRYLGIIKHRNFNPRLIEFITDVDRLNNISSSEYWKFIKQKLDNPAEIWKNTFDHQSDEYIRNIVTLVVLNGNQINEKNLIEAYNSINKKTKLISPSHTSKDFYTVIQIAVKYFLNRTSFYDHVSYSLFNPSIADFIINRYKHDEQKLTQTFLSLMTLNSLSVLKDISLNKIISEQISCNIILNLYQELEIIEDTEGIEYALFLFNLIESFCLENLIHNELKKVDLYLKLVNHKFKRNDLRLVNEFFTVLTSLITRNVFSISNYNFLVSLIETVDEELDNINSIIIFIRTIGIRDKDILQALRNLLHDYVINELDVYITDIDFDDYEFEWDDYNVNLVDRSQISDYIHDCLYDIMEKVEKVENLIIDEEEIKKHFNISSIEESLINNYIQNLENVCAPYSINSEINYTNSIEDLFGK